MSKPVNRNAGAGLVALVISYTLFIILVDRRSSISTGPPAVMLFQERDSWSFIKANDYNPPPGKAAFELARDLSKLLGSPDPQLRDETAYDILAHWIYQNRVLSDDDLRPLIAEWTNNLTKNIGSVGSDAVALRSFSALTLSVVVARDNAAPFLTEPEFRKILDSGLKYADQEVDLRGYDPVKGWLHATAHTADLLKFLARSRYIAPADQQSILNAVGKKLKTANVVFSFGEDERLARAVVSLIARKDFDAPAFGAWVSQIRPTPPRTSRPETAVLYANQNIKNMLAKLEVLLNTSDGMNNAPRAAVIVQNGLKGTF